MSALHKCDISVIIPVYNLEHWITPMLESLKAQQTTYDVEYIFVLNNCTDKSEEVIRKSGLDCTILNCTEQGCGCARNVGFENSHGNYIWFLDGDDWLTDSRAIQQVLTVAIVNELKILRIPYMSETYRQYYWSMVWQYLFKREVIEDIRFRKTQPAEDDVFMLQVFAKIGNTVPSLDRALYFYNYMREGSNMYRLYHGEDINK